MWLCTIINPQAQSVELVAKETKRVSIRYNALSCDGICEIMQI